MITIECDKCEQLFEVDPATTGERVSCPACGDINRVPGPATAPASAHVAQVPVARAAPAAPPGAAPSAAEKRGEKEVATIRPAMFRAHPFKWLLIVGFIVAGLALFCWAVFSIRVEDWLAWPGGIAAVLGAAFFIKWWVDAHLWIRLVVSDKRTVKHEGIIRRHSTEVLHDHVRSVDIRQNFLQRILNVGYIGIDSAGQDDIEIEIHDIPGPHKVKEIIDRYRDM
ncbi:MAG: PH domain-containing protein [Phycisphaerales bacterium]